MSECGGLEGRGEVEKRGAHSAGEGSIISRTELEKLAGLYQAMGLDGIDGLHLQNF